MKTEHTALDKLNELPIVGILRGISEEHIEKIAEAVVVSGLKVLEITMNTANATLLIKRLKKETEGKLIIGAGTVMNLKDLEDALNSGAEFIVTPCAIEEVIKYCSLNNIPVFPGALTPTEIYNAWQMGGTMIKVFPASLFGPKYFKEIKGPFDVIELMAVGGVTKETIAEYFKMGAAAVAFGAGIFKKEYFESKNFKAMEFEIKQLIEEYKKMKLD